MNKSVSDAPNKAEETYQLLEQLDHILKRPETYIGSNRPCREEMWIVDESGIEGPRIVKKEITERDHFSVVKEAKKKYNKLKENTVEFLKQRDELVRAFLKSDMPKWGSFTFQVK